MVGAMISFGTLSLIILAGLAGPLVSSSRRIAIPVVVGELLAGIALGKTGAGLINPGNPTIGFLGDAGFAVLMMVAGMHVPIRNRALIGSLGRGAIAVVCSALLGVGAGLGIAHGLDIGHPAVWAILLATGSAAIALPALEEANVSADRALLAMAWVTVADVSTIVAVPLVLNPSKAVRAGLGALAVVAGAAVILFLGSRLARDPQVQRVRAESGLKTWALDLRVALLALFSLCALAEWVGTNIMIAGFAAGLIVAVEGGPHRLSDQVNGVAAGFLVPVFFVVLGARLDVRALISSPNDLELAGLLIVGIVAVHVLAGRVIRAPAWASLVACAQLGVPVAVVKLGLAERVLTAGQGAAIIAAALASLGICAAGTAMARGASPGAAPSGAGAALQPTGP
jgi:Kef-type K+ transport system membrane component KefB